MFAPCWLFAQCHLSASNEYGPGELPSFCQYLASWRLFASTLLVAIILPEPCKVPAICQHLAGCWRSAGF